MGFKKQFKSLIDYVKSNKVAKYSLIAVGVLILASLLNII